MSQQLAVHDLKTRLDGRRDFALLDVRETPEYNLAHIPGACSLPRRLIEFQVEALVPYRGALTVVCDDDGRRAAPAAATLERLGYTNVAMLAGGLNRWVTEGFTTEWGVNVPSKDFGERLLMHNHVPEVEPDELHTWLERGDKIVMLDSRTPEEHQRSCIPGSRSMPGAELGLRAWDLADADTTIVVHCAGRTRSILGAGTLQRLGFKNIYALKNGTMGWLLAGLQLETGSQRLELPEPSAISVAVAESKARHIAIEEGVKLIGVIQLQELMQRAGSESVYLCDVRTKDEYAAGHVPGFRWTPGGQAVQASDAYIAVPDATIVFCCDSSVRSCMTASWFRQIGYPNVYALDSGTQAWHAAGQPLETGMSETPPLGLAEAAAGVTTIPLTAAEAARDAIFIHVGTSDQFSNGHVAGARWVPRSWLELRIGEIVRPDGPRRVIVTCADGVNSTLAAATLRELGYRDISVLVGGMAAWTRAGLPVEKGLTGVATAPDDVLPVQRSFAEMMNYLRWEEELGTKYREA